VGTEAAETNRLRRDVGLVGLTFVSLGSIIGSGWLLGALTVATAAGPASLISWLIGGALLALLALVHAELGGAYPVAGGTARFPHFAFGAVAGFCCGWMSWLGSALIAPVEVEAALSYLDKKIPGLVNGSGNLTLEGFLIATALMLAFTAVNLIGVRRMSESNTAIVVWKMAIPLITIVALFALSHNTSNFTAGGGFAPFGARGVMLAVPLGVVFSMQGFEQATQLGGEARNPQRDLARAVIGSMVIGTLIYLLLEVVFIGALDPAHLLHGWANPIGAGNFGPYAEIATGLGATWLAVLLYVDAFVSPAGTGLIYVSTASRLSYAMGRQRFVPPALAKVSRRGVPWVSILLAFVIGEVAFLPFPSWASLVEVISSAAAIMYAFGPVSLAALRRADPDRRRPYRLPASGLLCPAAFVAADLIIYWAGWTVLWKLLVALGVGVVVMGATAVFSRDAVPGRSHLRAALWVVPWLAGMAVIDYLGQYTGGTATIPFWWDLVVVVGFSLAIFALSQRLVLPPAEVHAILADDDEPYPTEEDTARAGSGRSAAAV
jgi:amino acid transporter